MTARKPTTAVFAAAALFLACEELPPDSELQSLSAAVESPPSPDEAELPSPPQREGMGLWGLGVGLQASPRGDDEPVAAEVEDAPERVGWTLSETALRHYIDWQQHLADAEALAEVALRVVDDETYPEALRRRAADFTEPERPARLFARFGLSREEVQHAEQLFRELSDLRDPSRPPEAAAGLRERAGRSARLFLGAVRDHDERTLREAASSLRAAYGDETVDVLLKHHASLPGEVRFLEDFEEAHEEEPAPDAVAEDVGL